MACRAGYYVRHPLQHRTWRWILLTALVVELVVMSYLVLNPSNAVPNSAIVKVTHGLQDVGVPAMIANTNVVEFLLNVALFVPLGATLALLAPKVQWWLWGLAGFLASSAVEGLQLMLLDGRTATVRDIAANTLGLAAGALLVTAARHVPGVREPKEAQAWT